MVREILFRGKRLDNGEWVYGFVLHAQDDDSWCITNEVGYLHDVNGNTVGQDTGLTDKNGVKIFEGDIILISDSTKPVLVEFINFSWECTNKKIGPYYRHRLEYNSKKYEVIGNIHDNPEILGGNDGTDDR